MNVCKSALSRLWAIEAVKLCLSTFLMLGWPLWWAVYLVWLLVSL
ncbi:hypothetical protein EVA_20493 [gut metagenome]|uniref:Uncharacterized protein n=1 Tax=gut metagenome TaxID=749906 RepID=J9BUZ2_9ZZZZ